MQTKMRKLLIILALGASLGACGLVYKIDIQQGVVLEDETLARLRTGLSKRQVLSLLGTPPITDPFHAQRWDYVYSMVKEGKLQERKRLSLFFDGETLSRIDGPHRDR